MKKKCQTELIEKTRKMETKVESLIAVEDYEQALNTLHKLIFLESNSNLVLKDSTKDRSRILHKARENIRPTWRSIFRNCTLSQSSCNLL